MKFRTFLSPDHAIPERGSGEIKTDCRGYIPARQQISNFIASGENLLAIRSRRTLEYDSDHLDDKDLLNYSDPTRDPDFDPVDVGPAMAKANAKLASTIKAASFKTRNMQTPVPADAGS